MLLTAARRALLIAALAAVASTAIAGDIIYMAVDANGTVHASDRPLPPSLGPIQTANRGWGHRLFVGMGSDMVAAPQESPDGRGDAQRPKPQSKAPTVASAPDFVEVDAETLWSMPSSYMGRLIGVRLTLLSISESEDHYRVSVGKPGGLISFPMNPVAFSVRIGKEDESFVRSMVKAKGRELMLIGRVQKQDSLIVDYYFDVQRFKTT
jgi:hypothetical protein